MKAKVIYANPGGDEMLDRDGPGPVTVFQTGDPGVLALAQSLLEQAGIDFFVAGEVVSGLYPGAVGPLGLPEIRVSAGDAEEARAVLKDLA